MSRLFGTDGVRGLAGHEPLTPETVARLSRAFGEALLSLKTNESRSDDRPCVLIGHDGRESADCLVAAVQSGLAAAGMDSQETGLITTPGLATLVRELGAAGGAMLSASHNPAHDNGIKLFNGRGEKLSDELERKIEDAVAGGNSNITVPASFGARRAGAAVRPEIYLGGLIERANVGRESLAGMRIALDGAHGGGSVLGPELLRMLGAEVFEIGTSPNGKNINDGFGALHPEKLVEIVKNNKCHLGLALDGDGDRSMFIDDEGMLVDGDGVIAACAPDLMERGRLPHATAVVSVMSNFGLIQYLRDRNIQLDQVAVGDRNVVARLRERGLALGAEPSGHVVFGADNEYIGDGLYTALRVLELLQRKKVKLSKIAHFERSVQVMVNVRVAKRRPLEELPDVQRARDEAEAALAGRGRVVLRYSGTEPLVRVMVESAERVLAENCANRIAAAVRTSLPL